MLPRRFAFASALALTIACGSAGGALAQTPPNATANPAVWPKTASPATITDAKTEAFITQLMSRMTVEEKVAQTIQADGASITPEELKQYRLGSVLVGGNSAPDGNDRASPQRWIEWTRAFRAAALEKRDDRTEIPIIFGVDAVHGHNNVVGATIFPHNVGLGAARDPDLIRRIGEVTAREMAASGADWTFGPTVAVPRDSRWGRAYEGYGEDPEIVAAYSGPMTLGLQGALEAGKPLAAGRVAGSAKHFLADGGTDKGRDQGDAKISEADLVRLHNAGYPPAIEAGILSVMVSFSSWNGVKHTGNKSLLTDVLKGRMGFEGFIVGDWNAHGQVEGCSNTSCAQAYNAGMDMMMAPDSWKGLYENTLAQVKAGQIPMARIDDAVRRILRAKVKAGLFEDKRPLEGKIQLLGAPEHRAVAREAVRKSLVLLKNEGVLPLKSSAHVLVAGDGADDIGKASGGWTLTWQGTGNKNSDFPNGQSIYAGVAEAVKAGGGSAELSVTGDFQKKPDVAIVVFGENPYAEFQGDITSIEYQAGDKRDLALLKKLKAAGVPVVSVFLSGRPLWTNPELNASDAFVAAWLPGSEGGGVADVLVGDKAGKPRHDFQGKLSFSWPKRADQEPINVGDPGYDPLFAYGYGLSYAKPGKVAKLSEDPGVASTAANVDRYFVDGRTPPPWMLNASGAASVKAVDAGAQENARQATWSGEGSGVVGIMGSPVDLSRQTTGDMAVMLRYRIDAAPTKPVSLSVSCGESCRATVDVTSTLSGAKTGEWRTAKIKLSCFLARGADMTQISSPFALATTGSLTLSFTEIRLASNEGDAFCPA